MVDQTVDTGPGEHLRLPGAFTGSRPGCSGGDADAISPPKQATTSEDSNSTRCGWSTKNS